MAADKNIQDRPVIGIDLGGTKILAAVVAPGGKIVGRSKARTQSEEGPDAVIARMIGCAKGAVQDAKVNQTDIAAVGVGAPGPLDPDEGVIIDTPNMPGWQNIPLAAKLSKGLNVPVFVDNDVNMGTFGEFLFGAAKGTKHAVGVFVGTGIGGGVIIGGELYHGFNKNAGEIGHMIVKAGGPRCGCGRRGCYEALASKTAIVRDITVLAGKGKGDKWTREQFLSGEPVLSSTLKKAVDKGDKMVIKVLRRASRYLGIGFGSLINLFGPEVIVVGGGVVEALGDEFLERARKFAKKYSLPLAGDNVRIVVAALGDDAAVLGAAAMAWRRAGAR
ncbi:MAG: ROK family protein [Planctomycetota bacterium]